MVVLMATLTAISVLLTGREPSDGTPEPAQATALARDGGKTLPTASRRGATPASPRATPKAPPPRIGDPSPAAPVVDPAPAAVEPPPPTPPARQAAPAGAEASELMRQALALAERDRPVEARRMLTHALGADNLSAADGEFIRDALSSLNRRLVFSAQVVPGDPFSRSYVVGPGERLGGIVKDQSLQVDWRFILRVNGIPDERYLRSGQRLKLVTGPFHAVVHKRDFRLDLYMGSGAERVYVASFPVGLGEYDSTPVGRFRVRPGSKLVNPAWVNPRTRESFGRDDPDNPIGDRWIGLQGIDDATTELGGYGIHGTIDPDSIGREASMGCIRMRPADVELVYEALSEGVSTVEIRP